MASAATHSQTPADGTAGMALVAELSDDRVFAGGRLERADFVDGMGEGFLAVDMLAATHGFEGDDGVGVIGGADHDGVDARRPSDRA